MEADDGRKLERQLTYNGITLKRLLGSPIIFSMINPDADSFLKHFLQIQSLAVSLSQDGIVVYGHSYDMPAFGSWVLILGTRKYRFRFTWDGKDGILKTEKALIPDSGTIIKWEDISLEFDTKSEGENIFRSIEDFIRKKFQAQQ